MTEIHIVNGLHDGLPFDYYTELWRGSKRISPSINLKAFTAVEIFFFHQHYGMTVEEVLRRLRAAGLDSLPGGGAEIFAPRVRKEICADKCDADEWLDVHRTAHRLGLRSNCTMLYGTIETLEERVDHLLRLRALQDETGGFQTFIPLAFHPENNALMKLPAPTGVEDLRTYRGGAPAAAQHPAHQGLLDHAGPEDRADRAVVRRRRSRRHRAGGEDLSHGRRRDAAGADPRRDRAPHRARGPHAGRARHALQRRRRGRRLARSGQCGTEADLDDAPQLRLAAVSFLNARPITYGLERGLVGEDRFELRFDLPSRCAAAVAARRGRSRRSCPSPATRAIADELRIVPGIAIARAGRCAPCCWWARCRWEEMTSIALDGASRSSQLLVAAALPRARAGPALRSAPSTTGCSSASAAGAARS